MGVCFNKRLNERLVLEPAPESPVKRRQNLRLSTVPIQRDPASQVAAHAKHFVNAPNSPLPDTELNEKAEVSSRTVVEGVLLRDRQHGFQDKLQSSTGEMAPAHLPGLSIGVVCKKGLKPESPNQDDFAIVLDPQFRMFCVFDGHGYHGHEVSNYAKKTLPGLLGNSPFLNTDPEKALRKAFLETNKKLSEECRGTEALFECYLSGTTATVGLLTKDALYLAHVGDSRAVISTPTGPQFATKDHKPNLPEEEARILQHGGEIKKLPEDIPYRIFKRGDSGPGLSISRALGDEFAASVGVSANPEISKFQVNEDTEFLVICSDGVWEFISDQEAVNVLTKLGSNCKMAAERLASMA